jgi:non-ribosomal peptide synthetase component F
VEFALDRQVYEKFNSLQDPRVCRAQDKIRNQIFSIMATVETMQALSRSSLQDRSTSLRFSCGPKISPPHFLIHEAFESVARANPTTVAARFGDHSITYQQLDIAANRLSHHLIDSGLKPQQRVCLVVQRSLEMLIGIFAILKAGCQYVPVDGGVTSEQALMHIFTDTEARFILCLPKFWDKVRRFARRDAVIFALGMEVGAFYPSAKPAVQVSSQDGAYAIYTSGMYSATRTYEIFTKVTGSTGKPKGVDVSHGNVTNALLLEPARLGTTVGTKVGQVLNIAFDMGEHRPVQNFASLLTFFKVLGRSWCAS